MDIPCQACLRDPSGVAGHADLMAQAIGDRWISFKCRQCQSFWTRSVARGGGFAWTAVTERVAHSPVLGVLVLPRADYPPVRMLPRTPQA